MEISVKTDPQTCSHDAGPFVRATTIAWREGKLNIICRMCGTDIRVRVDQAALNSAPQLN
jgi:hypothetical protein